MLPVDEMASIAAGCLHAAGNHQGYYSASVENAFVFSHLAKFHLLSVANHLSYQQFRVNNEFNKIYTLPNYSYPRTQLHSSILDSDLRVPSCNFLVLCTRELSDAIRPVLAVHLQRGHRILQRIIIVNRASLDDLQACQSITFHPHDRSTLRTLVVGDILSGISLAREKFVGARELKVLSGC